MAVIGERNLDILGFHSAVILPLARLSVFRQDAAQKSPSVSGACISTRMKAGGLAVQAADSLGLLAIGVERRRRRMNRIGRF